MPTLRHRLSPVRPVLPPAGCAVSRAEAIAEDFMSPGEPPGTTGEEGRGRFKGI